MYLKKRTHRQRARFERRLLGALMKAMNRGDLTIKDYRRIVFAEPHPSEWVWIAKNEEDRPK